MVADDTGLEVGIAAKTKVCSRDAGLFFSPDTTSKAKSGEATERELRQAALRGGIFKTASQKWILDRFIASASPAVSRSLTKRQEAMVIKAHGAFGPEGWGRFGGRQSNPGP